MSNVKEKIIDKNIIEANIKLVDENKELKNKINTAIEYVERMSYENVVDNPKKTLIKILKGKVE